MKTYEVIISSEVGAIVLFKTIQANSQKEAMEIVKRNVELFKGDTINIKEKEEI